MERATGTEVLGCGSPRSTDITLNIQTTTGGSFSISLNGKNTVEHLKKVVSKKLKVAKDRICLLHRERQLREGTLEENGLLDGARIILLPSVETGLLSQRPENSVMQALESLNENQVNDFLSGKSPLNLTMRLGDHMMLIQLQLSTLSSSSNSSRTLRVPTTSKNRSSSPASETKSTANLPSTDETTDKTQSTNDTDETSKQGQPQRVLQKQDLEILKNAFELYRSMTDEKFSNKLDSSDDKEDLMDTSNCTISDFSDTSIDMEQSPIKSLSNLVSNPIDENIKEALKDSVTLIDLLTKASPQDDSQTSDEKQDYSHVSSHSSEGSDLSNDSDNFVDQSSFLTESTIDEYPMEHLFNSAVDKGLFEDPEDSVMDREISNLATTSHGTEDSTPQNSLPSFKKVVEPLNAKRFHYLLHKTSKLKQPNVQNKQKVFMQSVVNKHRKRMQNRLDTPSTSRTEPFMPHTRKLLLQPSTSDNEDEATPSTSKELFKTPDNPKKESDSPTPQVETKDLIEASKNLTQKLKKLSKEVLTNKIDLRRAEEVVCPKTGPGAVIESMKHHGKGIYSGTFSGTLNPALQDRYGRPKRDISTIIHILNDLLCATPPISIATKDAKHSCSANASSNSKNKCMGCSQPSCSYGQCDGHAPSTSSADAPRKESACGCSGKQTKRATESEACPSCTEKTFAGDACRKCDTAKSLALENSKTKCKLEQLRLVMQQKKQRREARKLKTLPYNTPPKTIGSPEAAAPSIQEEIETVA